MEPRLLALFLLTTISIDLAVAAFAWQWRRQHGARLLVALTLAAALLSAAYGGEIARNTLDGKVAMDQTFSLTVALVAPLALLMAIWYAGFASWLTARRTVSVFTPALILLAIVLTNAGSTVCMFAGMRWTLASRPPSWQTPRDHSIGRAP
ncbi:MAG: hypothetical protein IPK16_10415 [Anaerolineales bacterium]|nr:hypothetical protein [Anaerolineales bacterium]